MAMTQESHKRPRESGATLIETAFILPILLMLLAGVVDLGRAYHTYITMINAAREGARYSIDRPWDTNGIRTVVINEAANSDVNLSTAVVTVTQSGADNPVTVQVQFTMPMLMGGILGIAGLPMATSATFRAR